VSSGKLCLDEPSLPDSKLVFLASVRSACACSFTSNSSNLLLTVTQPRIPHDELRKLPSSGRENGMVLPQLRSAHPWCVASRRRALGLADNSLGLLGHRISSHRGNRAHPLICQLDERAIPLIPRGASLVFRPRLPGVALLILVLVSGCSGTYVPQIDRPTVEGRVGRDA
jgi:hypothetical protein